jgi:hypothetical protein
MTTKATLLSSASANVEWKPSIQIDAKTASNQAFGEALALFWQHAKRLAEENRLPPNPFDHDGWFNITPQMAEAGLMHSGGNREIKLPGIRAAVHDMEADDWAANGESICFSEDKLNQGHHRLLAGLLSGKTFTSYVVVTVPKKERLFAYYDQHIRRRGHDALYIAGWNGAGKIIAKAIEHLAVRYDNDALGVQRQVPFRSSTPRETLAYLAANPELERAAHLMLGTYPDAVDVIRSKPAAVFFAWKVIETYDAAVLDNFCTALGSGANLDDDSPILAARNRLMAAEPYGKKLADRTRLAYVSKAFLMVVNGQKMSRGRTGKIAILSLDLDEKFPRIEKPVAEAAE